MPYHFAINGQISFMPFDFMMCIHGEAAVTTQCYPVIWDISYILHPIISITVKTHAILNFTLLQHTCYCKIIIWYLLLLIFWKIFQLFKIFTTWVLITSRLLFLLLQIIIHCVCNIWIMFMMIMQYLPGWVLICSFDPR